MKPPSEASSASGSAAIARLEGQNQKKPLSAHSQPMKKKVRDEGITGGSPSGDHSPQGGRRLDSQVLSYM